MAQYTIKTNMPIPVGELFSWHENHAAFKRLLPPWDKVKLLDKDPTLKTGSRLHMELKLGPLSVIWIAKHVAYNPPHEFVDIQEKGPFAKWIHRHQMIAIDPSTSTLKDHITFQTKGSIGEKFALKKIDRLFQYRHEILKHDLEVKHSFPHPSMTVAIAGASGMIGSALTTFLQTMGHRVLPIVRRKATNSEISWDPITGKIEYQKLENIDAVINLCGETIAERWTPQKKKRIYDSRIHTTRLLVDTLNSLENPPNAFLSTSAIGYYGNQTQGTSIESSKPGTDFLATVCAKWEAEANRFKAGRCIIPRLGIVLSSSQGALGKMTPFFRFGLGGVIGSGKQCMSWIALEDVVYAFYRILVDKELRGPINLCTPYPVTNHEFTKTLGKVLRCPTILPMKSFIVRSLMGEMGNATLLSSSFVKPSVLERFHHKFYYPQLEEALRFTFGKNL